jgi:hypothetical protein
VVNSTKFIEEKSLFVATFIFNYIPENQEIQGTRHRFAKKSDPGKKSILLFWTLILINSANFEGDKK